MKKSGVGWVAALSQPNTEAGRDMEMSAAAGSLCHLYHLLGGFVMSFSKLAQFAAQLFISLLFLCLTTEADAGPFKCRDADGKTSYSDRPCPSQSQSETLDNVKESGLADGLFGGDTIKAQCQKQMTCENGDSLVTFEKCVKIETTFAQGSCGREHRAYSACLYSKGKCLDMSNGGKVFGVAADSPDCDAENHALILCHIAQLKKLQQ